MLERSEFQGVLAYSLAEAIWLARSGIPDVLLGYPTLDHSGFTDLAQDDQLRESIMVVVDSVVHCDIIASAAAGRKIKVCIDIDASLRIGPLHVGVRRSPVHSAADAYALAAEIVKRPELSLTGLMFYDAQIAGLPDRLGADELRALLLSRCGPGPSAMNFLRIAPERKGHKGI